MCNRNDLLALEAPSLDQADPRIDAAGAEMQEAANGGGLFALAYQIIWDHGGWNTATSRVPRKKQKKAGRDRHHHGRALHRRSMGQGE
jgi:hypothetical protein